MPCVSFEFCQTMCGKIYFWKAAISKLFERCITKRVVPKSVTQWKKQLLLVVIWKSKLFYKAPRFPWLSASLLFRLIYNFSPLHLNNLEWYYFIFSSQSKIIINSTSECHFSTCQVLTIVINIHTISKLSNQLPSRSLAIEYRYSYIYSKNNS